MLKVIIRPMQPTDWPAVERIYRDGIATGNATFEPEPPTWSQFDSAKIGDVRLVAVDHDRTVIAWVAASLVSSRDVYHGVIEHSIYVAPAARATGVAGMLLGAFIAEAERAGYWLIQSSIFPENTVSLARSTRTYVRINVGLGYDPLIPDFSLR